MAGPAYGGRYDVVSQREGSQSQVGVCKTSRRDCIVQSLETSIKQIFELFNGVIDEDFSCQSKFVIL